MMRWLVVVYSLLAGLGAVTLGSSQGLQWKQPQTGPVLRLAANTNGDLYVFSTPYNASAVPALRMSRYSASGQLISDVAAQSGSTDQPIRAHIAIRGDIIYCLVTYFYSTDSRFRTRMSRYSISTATWSSGEWLGVNDYVDVTSAAFGDTHYVITGKSALLTDNMFLQKRRLSDSQIVLSQNFVGRPGQVVRWGADNFVANLSTTGGTTLWVVRVTDTFDLKTTSVPDTQGFSLVLADDAVKAYSIAQLNQAFGFYTRVFDVQTGLFGVAQTYSTNAVGSFQGATPLGTSAAAFLFSTFTQCLLVKVDANNLTVRDLGLPVPTYGRLARDGAGNAVGAFVWRDEGPRSLRTIRSSQATAEIMNTTEVALSMDGWDVADVHVDAAGNQRVLYRKSNEGQYFEQYLAQIAPARLSIAGPFTIGGQVATGTVTLDRPAPTGGATFLLYSNNAAAPVPTSVTIPAGQSSANFSINTLAVGINAKPIINARYDGLNLQTNFDLAAPLIQSVTATPQVQYGGITMRGDVHLTGIAPSGGRRVSLSSSNTNRVTVPSGVTVPAGATTASFTITTIPTAVNQSSVISATTGAVTKTVFVAVNAPFLASAALAQSTLQGGQSTSMRLELNAPAPASFSITLVSGSSLFVQLPSSYAIPQNETSVNVPVLTSAVSATTPVTLIAYRGPYVRTMTLTLTP